MGTALTGNTISSSYLGLIKTTDSAAISGSAKVLTDGAGNDSPLYLSTSRLGIGITPTSTLHVSGDFTLTGAFKDTSGSAGTSSYILSSTGSGTAWIANDVGDITSVVAGDGLTGGGTSGAVTINAGAGNLIDVQADQIDVDLSELTTSTSDADGDFFAVIDDANAQKKLTKGDINLSGFNNDIVSGTVGKIAKFTSTTAVGDSIVSESSSTLLIDPTGSGSHVGNIALTLLGVSGQDEQVYIYANGSSAENASIKLIPIGAGYGHIISSGNGLRLGTSTDTDVITITTSLVEITEDVQLTGTAPNIIFNDSAVTKNIAKILGNVDSAGTNGGKLEFQTVADSGASYITALAIDDSQQVGIGTTTPSALLNLESSSTSAFLIANRTNAVDGTKNLIDFKLDADDDNSYSAGSIGVEAEGTWTSTAGTRDGSIIFRPSINGTDTAGMVLTSSFDLGVGLTSPSDYYATDVVISSNDEGGLTFASTGTTFKQYIAWADGTSGDAQYRGYIAYDHNNDSMAIATSGSAKATIDSNGNIGIGTTTPTSYYSGADNLVVSQASGEGGISIVTANDTTGALYFADGTSGDAQYRGGIAYVHTSGTDLLNLVSGGATRMTIDSSGNAIFTKSGGAYLQLKDASAVRGSINVTTSDGLVFTTGASFTERMRIDSSGNVKLGSATTVTPATQADDLVIDKGATESGITIVSTSAGGIRFGDAASASVGFIEYGHTNNVMLFGANGSTSMSIKEKLVGINTTAPSFSLDVEAVDSGVQLQIGRTNTSAGSTWMGADSNGFHLGVGAYGVGNSVSDPNGFTVDTSGNVGIGSTSPTSVTGYTVLEINNATNGGILDLSQGDTMRGRLVATTSSLSVETSGTIPINFFLGGSNRMTINSDGSVGIGVTSAINGSNLSIKGAATANQQIISLHNPATSGTVLFMAFGTETTYAERGYITYDQTNVAFTQVSDVKLKKNIRDLQNGLDTILKIKPRVYDWKDGRKNNVVGFVAQEVEQIKPNWVKEKDGLKMLDTNLPNTIPYLIKAIQEQQDMIQELKAEIDELKKK